jgi:glycosyltransferase involved in cell wall biosynthesis
MKILHVCSWFQPQLGYSEYHLPIALQRLGHSVAILTSDRYYPFPDYETTVRPILGSRIVRSGVQTELGLKAYRQPVLFECRHHLWLRKFNRVLAEFRPEIVHVYQTFTLPTLQSALGKSRFGYGLIVRSTMEKEVFVHQPPGRRLFYRFFSGIIAPVLRRRVDCFTAVGSGAQEIVANVVRMPREKVQIVPLGADTERFRFNEEGRKKIRDWLCLPDDAVVIIYAGKLLPKKDVHVLAEAFQQLAPRRRIGLLLLGNGTPEYEQRLRDILGNSLDKAHLLPPVPNAELRDYFSAADIAVWPSESSNAALEAASAGLPIVVCDSEGSRSYVEAGNGLKFPRGDAVALASSLIRLIDDRALRKEMGECGRLHVTNNLSWDAIARRSVETYRMILSQKMQPTFAGAELG